MEGRGMKKLLISEKNFIFLFGVIAIFLAAFLPSVPVEAENASVTFGSAEYVPQENGTFQVGVYIQCDAPDFIYNATLQYDPARMEYLGGADGGENGTLHFAGEASGGQRQYMLSFRALTEGAGTISVTQAEVITNPSSTQGEGAMGAEPAEGEQIAVPVVADITQLGSASIQVQPVVDCRLSELQISQIPDFTLDPDVYEYDLTVPSDTENLDITASARDSRAAVEVSGTELITGENTIAVTVTGSEDTTKYLLHVTRLEGAAENTEESVEPQEEKNAWVPSAETANPGAAESAAPALEETGSEGNPEVAEIFKSIRAGFSVGWINGAVSVAVILILAACLIRLRRKNHSFFDEDEEDDWDDLTTDEKWLNWLEAIEEEEMEDVLVRAKLRKKKPSAAKPVHKGRNPHLNHYRHTTERAKSRNGKKYKNDRERGSENRLYTSGRLEEWVTEKEEGRKDAPDYRRKRKSAGKAAAATTENSRKLVVTGEKTAQDIEKAVKQPQRVIEVTSKMAQKTSEAEKKETVDQALTVSLPETVKEPDVSVEKTKPDLQKNNQTTAVQKRTEKPVNPSETSPGPVKMVEKTARQDEDGKTDVAGPQGQPETSQNLSKAKESPAAPQTAEIRAVPAIDKPAEAETPKKPQDTAQPSSMEEPVIRVKDVSMRFKISEVNAGSLKEYLLVTVKRQNKYHELEALKHISFDVKKGEVIGIIGTNGSGKSTLLKLIAGVLKPSEGKIEVDHRKVQLLTLGTGFDSELTARENVYLNGAIIGYSKEFIDENYEKIVEFAELDGFMDEKIKNFSSGMMSRLGFSIATVGKAAEILILDEVLSVGDMFFRKKSEKRIKEMIHGGSTVLIVSHSTDTIIKNCTRAVWIEKGVLMEIGEPKKVCEAYQKKAG